MRIIEWLLNWDEIVARGTDATIYFVMAAAATLLFVIRLGMALFGGDVDADGGADADAGHHSDTSFTIFSLLSILAFFMGAGWAGLAARVNWGFERFPSSLISAGFGTLLMFTAAGMTHLMRRANAEPRYDVQSAIGRTGRAYLPLPAKGQGSGQVEVTVSGRRKIFSALSNGPAIPAFRDVKVVAVRDDETLVVEPAD